MSDLFPFTASNGYTLKGQSYHVTISDDDGDNSIGEHGYLDNADMKTLREFFQAERDAELGRWRSKEHPDYVVYPIKLTGSDDPSYRECQVVAEATGNTLLFGSDLTQCFGGEANEVAREFFAAHPEPKPWHDAKPGEAWLVTADGDEQLCVARDDNPTDPNEFVWAHGDFPVTADYITAAERVHPRGGDES